jgi:PAS domain S-box-containing protein
MARILVVDDILENRYLLEVLLRGYGNEVVVANDGAEALVTARSFPPDLIIADILMPVMDGYSLCRSWKADPELCRIPFIFYTATYTEPEDQEFALSLGAERFIIKPQEPEELDRIVREVLAQHWEGVSTGTSGMTKQEADFFEGHNRALFRKLEKKMIELDRMSREVSQEKAERRRLEDALVRGEELIRNLFDAAPLAVVWMDCRGNVLFSNRLFADIFGYRTEEIPDIFSLFRLACPNDEQRAAAVASWNKTVEEAGASIKTAEPFEVKMSCKDGTIRHVSVVNAVIDEIYLAMFNDVTNHKQLESQLLHAQKMELVGMMTGGVVHDLNNFLTVIAGYGHLLMKKLPAAEPSRQFVEQILRASDHASSLAGSISAFSRKRKTSIRPVKLNEIVRSAESLLRRLIPREVELKTALLSEDMTIRADTGQIEQVLMNLVTNARDAISGKGTVTISTALATPDDRSMKACGTEANRTYALLAVDDTGNGMDDTMKERIFEPFFTTKAVGKGTGLGLAVVHEIVKLHHGTIEVDSERNRGTRFNIYLPAG